VLGSGAFAAAASVDGLTGTVEGAVKEKRRGKIPIFSANTSCRICYLPSLTVVSIGIPIQDKPLHDRIKVKIESG
jgi:hypothetical protein